MLFIQEFDESGDPEKHFQELLSLAKVGVEKGKVHILQLDPSCKDLSNFAALKYGDFQFIYFFSVMLESTKNGLGSVNLYSCFRNDRFKLVGNIMASNISRICIYIQGDEAKNFV